MRFWFPKQAAVGRNLKSMGETLRWNMCTAPRANACGRFCGRDFLRGRFPEALWFGMSCFRLCAWKCMGKRLEAERHTGSVTLTRRAVANTRPRTLLVEAALVKHTPRKDTEANDEAHVPRKRAEGTLLARQQYAEGCAEAWSLSNQVQGETERSSNATWVLGRGVPLHGHQTANKVETLPKQR